MTNVHLGTVLCAFGVIVQRPPDVFSRIFISTIRDGCTAPAVHPAHEHVLHRHDDQLVHDAVRIEGHDVDVALFVAALVEDVLHLRLGGDIGIVENELVDFLNVLVRILQDLLHVPAFPLALAAFLDGSADQVLVEHPFIKMADSLRHGVVLLVYLRTFRDLTALLSPVLTVEFLASATVSTRAIRKPA